MVDHFLLTKINGSLIDIGKIYKYNLVRCCYRTFKGDTCAKVKAIDKRKRNFFG